MVGDAGDQRLGFSSLRVGVICPGRESLPAQGLQLCALQLIHHSLLKPEF